jgi:5-methyltetrahydropteroyltriglutamate--homocysteine methyltransferase
VPGPYTLAGRLDADRWETAEALLPIVQAELIALADAGCTEIAVDEPSMSCYAHREDPERLVDLFNRTVAPVAGRARLSTHLCFGNYKGRAVAPRSYRPLFPAFLGVGVDEIHLEMASREQAESELVATIAEVKDVAVGVIDVKSYYVETPEDVAERVRAFTAFAPPERLAFSTDCGLSQTARWAAKQKLANLVAGVRLVRDEL